MLEAVNLLSIYRRLKQLKARLHGHTWAHVRLLIRRPNPPKTWLFLSVFAENLHGEFVRCWEGKIRGILI